MFRTQNLCPGSKNVFVSRQNIFCFPSSKICFRNTCFRAAKLGNICIRNNVSATMFPSLARPLASTTGTATTTPQTKNLIGRVWKNNHAARAARSYEQVRAVLCKTTT